MKNKKAEEVIKRLTQIEEENRTCAIEICGDEQNKLDGFSIIMHNKEGFSSFGKNEYCGISKQTINLLDEAEIKYKILK